MLRTDCQIAYRPIVAEKFAAATAAADILERCVATLCHRDRNTHQDARRSYRFFGVCLERHVYDIF